MPHDTEEARRAYWRGHVLNATEPYSVQDVVRGLHRRPPGHYGSLLAPRERGTDGHEVDGATVRTAGTTGRAPTEPVMTERTPSERLGSDPRADATQADAARAHASEAGVGKTDASARPSVVSTRR